MSATPTLAIAEMTGNMSGKRQEKHSAETCYEEAVNLFAAFYLLFEFRQNSDFALIFGFENRHNRIIWGSYA